MNYKQDTLKRKAKRKQKLPLWKTALPLLLLTLPVLSWAEDLSQALRGDARTRLASYARQAAWPRDYKVRTSAWLPASTKELPPCETGLAMAPSNANDKPWGRIPYDVSCPSPQWQLRARVEVTVTLSVWTARRSVRRGENLSQGDLLRRPVVLDDIYGGFITDASQLLGYEARRNLRSGQVLSANMVAPPMLVRKGEDVVIRVRVQGVTASMKGQALSDGGKGDSIRVRNLSSGKELSAWVVEKGVVETRF